MTVAKQEIFGSIGRPAAYDLFARVAHWLTVLMMIGLFFSGYVWRGETPASTPFMDMLRILHKSLGVTVFLVAVLRIAYRSIVRVPALPETLPPWQIFIARATEILLYVTLLIQPLSGYLLSSVWGHGFPWFGTFQFPLIHGLNFEFHTAFKKIHVIDGVAVLVLIGIHSLGALYHHYILRDDTLRHMILGKARETGRPKPFAN